ncbi:Uncharacterised protein [Legionella bozemanae]|uniref:Uncharacterized protein n=1 Tax=Legionella bozemanae TaxID=447 RepID=A0A0W0RJD6_LEGBO|nr:hypothetical protein Lboz_2712 [Legionella bozemanae]STO33270.1 Uncharacterised protein [Legionella bozemanae]
MTHNEEVIDLVKKHESRESYKKIYQSVKMMVMSSRKHTIYSRTTVLFYIKIFPFEICFSIACNIYLLLASVP